MAIGMEARVTRLEEDFEAIGTTVLETRAAVDRLEKGFAKHTKQLASLEVKVSSLDGRMGSLETKVDGHTVLLQEILRRLPAAA